MKLLKIILNALAIPIGAVMILASLIQIFRGFNGLTIATGTYEVSFHIGYLVMAILLGCLSVWIFWRGISFFIKKNGITKEEIEKKINDI